MLIMLNHPDTWRGLLPRPDATSHKYTRGHAIVYGGPLQSAGAARLAAMAALRAGAGLVSVVCDKRALSVYAASLIAVMTKPCRNTHAFRRLIADERITSLLIGPGAGVNARSHKMLREILQSRKPCVLDADALNLLAKHEKLQPLLHDKCILTPHEGEFSRLFSLQGDKLSRARQAAQQTGAVVLLKGAETAIASPDGQACVNNHAPATLATAGAGDVLAGIIAGLLAQGMLPYVAACAGAWLHGEAAHAGGTALIAEDLPALLGKAFTALR